MRAAPATSLASAAAVLTFLAPSGPAAADCPDTMPEVRLAEMVVSPASDRAVELRGETDASLDCFELVGYRASEGDGGPATCDERLSLALDGEQLAGESLVLSAPGGAHAMDPPHVEDASIESDLLGGPYLLTLRYQGEVVDAVDWGEPMPACEGEAPEGVGPEEPLEAPSSADPSPIVRCDKGDPEAPFVAYCDPSATNPGGPSLCPCPPDCPAEMPAEVPIVSEVKPRPSDGKMLELSLPGASAVSLRCFELRGVGQSGGDDGPATCNAQDTSISFLSLQESAIPYGGRMAIAPDTDGWFEGKEWVAPGDVAHRDAAVANIGSGFGDGYAIDVAYRPDGGEPVVVDRVRYGNALPACKADHGEPNAAYCDTPSTEGSLSRCVGGDEEGAFLAACDTPSPGAALSCSCGEAPNTCTGDDGGDDGGEVECPEEAPADARLAEVVLAPSEDKTVEIRGEPGASLACLELVGLTQSDGGEGEQPTCQEDVRLAMHEEGLLADPPVMPDDGSLVLAANDSGAHAGAADAVDGAIGDLTSGDYMLTLRFDGEILDTVAWGQSMPACEEALPEGVTAPEPLRAPGFYDPRPLVRCDKSDPSAPFVDYCGMERLDPAQDANPGGEAKCDCPPECPAQTPQLEDAVREVKSRPGGQKFVELVLPPAGGDVNPRCLELRGFEQVEGEGDAGPSCQLDPEVEIPLVALDEADIPDDGRVVLAPAEEGWPGEETPWAEGVEPDYRHDAVAEIGSGFGAYPYGLGLFYAWEQDEPTLVDGVRYGAEQPACGEAYPNASGVYCGNPANEGSLHRCPASEGLPSMTQCGTPTPGSAAACGCEGATDSCACDPAEEDCNGDGGDDGCQVDERPGDPYLAEVVVSPSADRAVELRGPAGMDLSCFELVGLQQGDNDDGETVCEERMTVALDEVSGLGEAIPDDGSIVLAASEEGAHSGAADAVVDDVADVVSSDYMLTVQFDGTVTDAVAWGQAMPKCEAAVSGDVEPPEPLTAPDQYRPTPLVRCDKTDAAAPFVDYCGLGELDPATKANPGGDSACACPPDCPSDLPGDVPVVAEVKPRGSDENGGKFIELEVPADAGVSARCFELRGLTKREPEGGEARCGVDPKVEIPLVSLGDEAVPTDRHLVVAPDDEAWADGVDWASHDDVDLHAEGVAEIGSGFNQYVYSLGVFYAYGQEEPQLVDRVRYGGEQPLCDQEHPTNASYADNAPAGGTLRRCSEGDGPYLAPCEGPPTLGEPSCACEGAPSSPDAGADAGADASGGGPEGVEVSDSGGCRSAGRSGPSGGTPLAIALALLGVAAASRRRRRAA